MPNVKRGFTIIELLLTITIIGVLASIAIVTYPSSQKVARDAQRKHDIAQYSTSLETFANKNNSLYPQRAVGAGVTASTTLCTDLGLTTCTEDPKNTSDASFIYLYQSDGSGSTGTAVATKYVLWAKLENSTKYWVACSSGKVGTKDQTGFSVSGGVCPL